MPSERNIEVLLEELRQGLPDPFELRSNSEAFFRLPAAQELLEKGEQSARAIVGFLGKNPNPVLVRPAMLLLSGFAPASFHQDLFRIIGKASRGFIEALETGLWFVHLSEEQIARDLMQIVLSSGNPYPLLLLQRPAAKAVRSNLAGLIHQHELPASLYALYCYGYILAPEDVPLLQQISAWTDIPEMAALAGIYLLKLGSKDGAGGIRSGLLGPDEDLRKMTYHELADYLPENALTEAQYDPRNHGTTQEVAVDRLLSRLIPKRGPN